MVPIGMHRPFRTHHQRGLAAVDSRAWMQRAALLVALLGAHGHVVAHDGEVVAIERRVVARAVVAAGGQHIAAAQCAQRFGQQLAEAVVEVVAGLVCHGQHRKALLAIIVIEMIEQLEARARRQRAGRAFAVELLVPQL